MNSLNKLVIITSIAFLAACGAPADTKEVTMQKIDALKKQQAEITTQIGDLEAQIAAANPEAANQKLKMVEVLDIAPKEFLHFIEIQGSVQSDENVMITAQMPGVITKINVTEGKQVRKGQILAEMDANVLKSTISEVESSYELVKNLFQKQQNLWNQKIGTELQYLTAKNNKESLEKRLATLNEQLELTKIKSPINGTVDMIVAKVGENTAPGMPAFRVVNPAALTAKADVAESYASKIKQGSDVILSFPDIDKEVRTRINYTSKVIDPMSRTFSVEAKLQSNAAFRPNMLSVFKIIDYRNKSAMVVPVNVIQNSDQGSFVLIATGTGKQLKVEKRMITVGVIYNDLAEIKSGLVAGDKVVTTGFQGLNEGQTVRLN